MRPERVIQSKLRDIREQFGQGTQTTVLALIGLFGFLLYVVITSLAAMGSGSNQPAAIAGVAVFGALGLALALTKLDWAIFLTMLLVPAYTHNVGGDRTAGPWELLLFCSAFGLLAKRLTGSTSDEEDVPRGNLERLVDLVVLLFVASDLLSACGALLRRGYMPGVWIRALEGGILYWLARDMLSRPKSARRLLKYIAICGASQAVVGLAQHFQLLNYHVVVGGLKQTQYWLDRAYLMRFIGRPDGIAAFGTLTHHNIFGCYVNMCWPAALVLALLSTGQARRAWTWTVVASAMAIVWSYSRGAFMSLAGAGVVLFNIVPKGKLRSTCRAGSIALVLMGIGWWHWANSDADYAGTLNLNDRKQHWAEMMQGFPADAYELFLGRGARSTSESRMGAHSSYMLLRYENGLFGLTTFVLGGLVGLLVPLAIVAQAPTLRLAEYVKIAGVASMATYYLHAYSDHIYLVEATKVMFLASFALASAPYGLPSSGSRSLTAGPPRVMAEPRRGGVTQLWPSATSPRLADDMGEG